MNYNNICRYEVQFNIKPLRVLVLRVRLHIHTRARVCSIFYLESYLKDPTYVLIDHRVSQYTVLKISQENRSMKKSPLY